MEDYPELREWLYRQEGFYNAMNKSPWVCIIKDNEAYHSVKMLELMSKTSPSILIVVMPDGSFKDFWLDVYENQQNIPYDIRLATYSKFYLVF